MMFPKVEQNSVRFVELIEFQAIFVSLSLFVQLISGQDPIIDNITSKQNVLDNLIFVHTICRHGDRNIKHVFPNDPWKSEDHWTGGFGQLTNLGKQQHYELGQYLRQRYAKLIDDSGYSAKNIYIDSTDYDRVLMSAQACLSGMFPPEGDQIWNNNVIWQPIPVHTKPSDEEYLLALRKPSHRYTYLLIKHLNESNFVKSFQRYRPLISFLEENSGLTIQSLTDLVHLYDTLYIEKLKNRLPSWAVEVMKPGGEFENLHLLWYETFTATTEMKKLHAGFLLKDIFNRFTNKSQKKLSPDRSLWLYFGHDKTIISILNSLKLYEYRLPPYASCIFMELYEHNDDPYVQIFYRNTTETNIKPLEVPNCGTKCPLSKIYDLYDDILPTGSFDEESSLRDGESTPSAYYKVLNIP